MPAMPEQPGITISALLLDRDGVINRELGRSVRTWQEFEFLPGVLDALRRLADLPAPILVLSNQSAIGRGWVSTRIVDGVHQRMIREVRSAGGRIDDVAVCPHAPEANCACRKPKPGLLLMMASKHRFDLRRAVMVGDSHRDVEAANAAGAIPILVRSGHPIPPSLEERLKNERTRVMPDLVAVAGAILTRSLLLPNGGE
jgi:D-glycero-D-manno-heptose 1,7-bisphosphate phosphatase